ncbi:hypothetical protein [Kitasatospora sp. GP82]|uniref:hypothetical protein n=1 Tax=Kitasatospora sp. GP82 TaxID=3035089 RepID=UPI00247707CD|nr:hypothetical protein [Kitasatospora sp. GP82]MDH6124202.1 hypothetical protein [Kitasatospora sp. GP82]
MSSGDDTGERNPFAPPPAGAPDQPWQPRTPQQPPAAPEDEDERAAVPPPHPWSPHYQGGWSAPQQPKFDPNDPVQRRSRYALAAGMGALFCLVTGIAYVSLLLGALALYWGVSALRSPRQSATEGTPAPVGPTPVRPQTPAAVGGLVTGGVAVLFVLGFLGVNLYYNDYVTCVNDSLTAEAQQGCSPLGPKMLVDLYNGANQ